MPLPAALLPGLDIVFSGIVTPVFRSWFHLEAGLSVCPDTVVVNITESHFDQWTKRR